MRNGGTERWSQFSQVTWTVGGEAGFESRVRLEPMPVGGLGMCAHIEVPAEAGEMEECWSRA